MWTLQIKIYIPAITRGFRDIRKDRFHFPLPVQVDRSRYMQENKEDLVEGGTDGRPTHPPLELRLQGCYWIFIFPGGRHNILRPSCKLYTLTSSLCTQEAVTTHQTSHYSILLAIKVKHSPDAKSRSRVRGLPVSPVGSAYWVSVWRWSPTTTLAAKQRGKTQLPKHFVIVPTTVSTTRSTILIQWNSIKAKVLLENVLTK